MQRRNQILERILIIALIIFVIVFTTFVILEKKIKFEREMQEEEDNPTPVEGAREKILSNEEALQIGKDLYNTAKSVYWKENIEYVKEIPEGSEYAEIVQVILEGKIYGQIANYDNFVGNKFTENGEAALRSYLGILASKENDKIVYYIPLSERARNTSYVDTDLDVIAIDANLITFYARSKYYPSGVEYNPSELNSSIKTEEKTELFVIKKTSDNVWKIDTFKLPN